MPLVLRKGLLIQAANAFPLTAGDPTETKDFRFVKWLSRQRKLQGIPPSAFFSEGHKAIGEDYIRFCFIKVGVLGILIYS